jgi:hypothetical protein
MTSGTQPGFLSIVTSSKDIETGDIEAPFNLQGKTILLPGNPSFRSSTEQLGWHNDYVYRA